MSPRSSLPQGTVTERKKQQKLEAKDAVQGVDEGRAKRQC